MNNNTTIHIGESGWRAIISDGFTWPKLAAIGLALARSRTPQKIVIGYDNRFLSPLFASNLAEIFENENWKVDLVREVFPTPGIAKLVREKKYTYGLVITASHNPYYYNGLKIFTSPGILTSKAFNAQISEQAQGLLKQDLPAFKPELPKKTKFDWQREYLKHLLDHIDTSIIRRSKLRVAWDCFGGSTSKISPAFFKKLQLKNFAVPFTENPNFQHRRLEPDSESTQTLRKLVQKEKAHVGLATDLDGDRFAILDEKGNFVLPNLIGPLFINHLLGTRQEKGTLYQTVSCSNLSRQIAEQYGAKLIEVPVGFQKMGTAMAEDPQALLGFEETGGVAYAPYLFFKDGLMAHAFILEILATQKKPLSQLIRELLKRFGPIFYKRLDLKTSHADQWNDPELWEKLSGEKITQISELDGKKFYLQSGWVLVRQSKTENLIRLYFEFSQEKMIKKIFNQVKKII